MKTTITSAFKMYSQKAGIIMLLISCFYGMNAPAQSDRRGDQRNRNQGDAPARQSMRREQTNHQRTPNINRSPAQAGNPGNSGINPERNIPRINNNNAARRGNGYNSTENRINQAGNGNYSRPGNNFNNRDRGNWGYSRNNHYRRPVYNAHNPNWRYTYAPRRNSIFNTLPLSYFSINFGGFGYRYYDGIYYRPYNNIFRVVAPPIGIFINTLPFGYSRIYVHDYPYYYYNGTYYDYRNNNYTVVSPPVGAVVESIPDGYETLTIDGETYYEVDGAQYKPVVQKDGTIWYEVIKAN
ncbi:MAG: DUF6515 family protein [Ferruginibacter sp.]